MKIAGKYLLDANIVIAYLADDPVVKAALRGVEEAFLPCVVLGELHFGAHKSARAEQNLKRVEEFAAGLPILDCDAETARVFGELKNELRLRGRPIPDNDLWIAATARQHGLILVSRDAHFAHIVGFDVVAWN